MPITLNIPEVPVTQPSTPPNGDVIADAGVGATNARIYLPTVTNDGNTANTLRLTISNAINCTVERLGFVVNGSLTSRNNITVFEVTLQPTKTADGDVILGVNPGMPGEPASQATADYLYEWV